MSQSAFAASSPTGSLAPAEYQPGVCNIGPAEIARRRRAGHTGLIATIVLFAVLVAVGVPPIARLLLIVPAAVSASGYLQAWLKFCAGFGSAGVFNFGEVGTTEQVVDDAARRADRARALRIGVASFAIGAVVAAVAVALGLAGI